MLDFRFISKLYHHYYTVIGVVVANLVNPGNFTQFRPLYLEVLQRIDLKPLLRQFVLSSQLRSTSLGRSLPAHCSAELVAQTMIMHLPGSQVTCNSCDATSWRLSVYIIFVVFYQKLSPVTISLTISFSMFCNSSSSLTKIHVE